MLGATSAASTTDIVDMNVPFLPRPGAAEIGA
jgi:hypothetical protein